MSAIGYFLEAEGIMTTGISLVRENTESLRPPRALWVSFPLGRPLGIPGNQKFQHKVIKHALELLDRPSGPVLEDFPLDAPDIEIDQAPACPVSFAQPSMDGSSWQAKLNNELLLMKPWYELSRRRRGRTTVGLSGSSIDECVAGIAPWLEEQSGELPELNWLKAAIEDLKAYYSEALTAQPGEYSAKLIQTQLWQETVLGEALKIYHDHFAENPNTKMLARILAPRSAFENSE